jgi:hypothetical protein
MKRRLNFEGLEGRYLMTGATQLSGLSFPAAAEAELIERIAGLDLPSTLLATGLEGAQGSTIGPGHDLYVTENVAGRISRIDLKTGEVTTFASGLPISPFAGLGAIPFN